MLILANFPEGAIRPTIVEDFGLLHHAYGRCYEIPETSIPFPDLMFRHRVSTSSYTLNNATNRQLNRHQHHV